jgi:hypothetical protein
MLSPRLVLSGLENTTFRQPNLLSLSDQRKETCIQLSHLEMECVSLSAHLRTKTGPVFEMLFSKDNAVFCTVAMSIILVSAVWPCPQPLHGSHVDNRNVGTVAMSITAVSAVCACVLPNRHSFVLSRGKLTLKHAVEAHRTVRGRGSLTDGAEVSLTSR